MKPWIWLRVASGFLALFTVGHSLGHFAPSDVSPEQKTLTEAMKNFRFDVMGSNRSAWDFFRGFSLLLIVNLALLAALTWLLANLARSSPARVRPFIWALVVGQSLLSVICWTNFFLAPALMSTLAALSLLMAALGLQKAVASPSA